MKRQFPIAALAAATCALSAHATNVNVILGAPAGPNPLGTYNPGQVVPITVSLRHSATTALSGVRFVQIDYSASTAGVVDVNSDAIDGAFPGGTVTNTTGSNLLIWDSGISGALSIPGSAGTPVVFCTFNVTMPLTPGTGVLVSVLGPVADDGAATGAHFESDTAGVWANGDADAANNVGLGTIGLSTAPDTTRDYQTIYSAIATSNSSLVPGGTNVTLPPNTRFSAFDRPYASPNRNRWAVSVDTDNATTTADELILTGTGLLGVSMVQEGWGPTQIPVMVAGHTLAGTTERMGINDSGEFAFRNAALGTPTTNNVYALKWNGSAFVVIAQESQAYTGFPFGGTPGNTIDSAMILNNGTAGFFTVATVAGSITAANNDLAMLGSTTLFQQNRTFIPTGQIGTPAAPDSFSQTLVYSSEAGDYLMTCSLPGSTNDDMIVRNGAVLVQEGAIPTGSGFTSPVAAAGITTAFMDPDGTYFITASNADGEDWVMRDGTILVTTDDPITPANTEVFDDALFADCFFWMRENNLGDYIIGGTTNFPDTDFDAVLVLNGATVVARQGDPIDLNRNGLNDDDAYIGTFNNDDGFLTDNMLLYMTVLAVNGAGTTLDQVFVRLDLTPCDADTNLDDQVNVTDLLAVISAWGACPANGVLLCPDNPCPADTNGDCTVNVTDLLAVISNWGGCP